MKILEEIRMAMNVDTTLVAVSKYRSNEDILFLHKKGITDFGENRVQELVKKANLIPHVNWHLIGRLQTNKVALAIEHASLIHSLDREGLAVALQKEAKKQNKVVRVLIQVNLSRELTKAGFFVEDVASFLHTMGQYPNLHVEGVMCMGPHLASEEVIRAVFRQAKSLFDQIKQDLFSSQIEMKYLSMGMSDDYLLALEEGSNLLRIGSLLFDGMER